MKKTLLSAFAFLLVITFAKAQSGNKASISIGPDFGIPINTTSYIYGESKDFYSNGFGISFKVETPITSSLHFTGSIGYVRYVSNVHYANPLTDSSFPGSASIVQAPAYEYVPIKVGLQYYYDKYFYISGETGAAIQATSVSTTSFIYSGGLGAVIPLDMHSGLDISARYERGFLSPNYDSPMSQVAIRVAYKFGF